jgi:hypothetical protein
MIHNVDFPAEMIDEIWEIFYEFCRKHNIKQGKPYKKDGKVIGYKVANFDWTMTRDFFIKHFIQKLEMSIVFDDNIPEDLKG